MAEFEDLKEEAELLLNQLQSVQVQLEEEVLSHASTRKENSRLLAELQEARSQLDSQILCNESTRNKNARLLRDLRRAKSRLESQSLRHEASREEKAFLLRQFHQAQEELEQYYYDCKEKETALTKATAKLSANDKQLKHCVKLLRAHVQLQERISVLIARALLRQNSKSSISPDQL